VKTLNLELRTLNPEQKKIGQRTSTENTGRKYDLEERLLEFASAVMDVSEKLPNSRAGNHIAGQFLRSGTSPYGNHGEAQAPESAEDFIHKMKICLKELRETRRWLRLIERKHWLQGDPQFAFILCESEELIRIFKASVQTAERNKLARKRNTSASPPKPGVTQPC
jgi:four helix bundle protein